MNILVIHLGCLTECFIASSINKGLLDLYPKAEITWVVKNTDTLQLFKYNNNIKYCYIVANFIISLPKKYDVIINLNFDFMPNNLLESKEFLGCNSANGEKYRNNLTEYETTKKSLFEIYYDLANMKWKGEGYDFTYYPKNRSKDNRVGLALSNNNLKNFIDTNVKTYVSNKWYVPNKKNIFKKLDEINRCETIITDDLLILNLSLYLRKYVFYLKTTPVNTRIELFKSGEIFEIPYNYNLI